MTKVPENLLSLALNTPKVSSAVVCANQISVLESVKEATEINLVQPILIGDKKIFTALQMILISTLII